MSYGDYLEKMGWGDKLFYMGMSGEGKIVMINERNRESEREEKKANLSSD